MKTPKTTKPVDYVKLGESLRDKPVDEIIAKVKKADIKSGGTGMLENTVQQTTTGTRNNITDSQNKFDNLKGSILDQANDAYSDTEKTKGDISNTRKGEEEIFDETTDPFGIKAKLKASEKTYKGKVEKINSDLSALQNRLDSSSSALISSIKNVYAGRIKEMENKNQAVYNTKTQLGFRQGRSRYVQGVQQSILTDEELSGLDRIATLEGDMFKLIAEAEQAQAANNMKMFTMKQEELNTAYKNMQDEVKTLYDNAIAQDKAIREQEKAERDALKADFDLSVSKSESAAPALAEKIKEFTNPADREAFIQAYAKLSGISDPDILYGELEKYLTEEEMNDLDVKSKKASISNTYSSINEKETDRKRKEGINKIRNELYTALSNDEITLKDAKDVWTTAEGTLKEFNDEFEEFLD